MKCYYFYLYNNIITCHYYSFNYAPFKKSYQQD